MMFWTDSRSIFFARFQIPLLFATFCLLLGTCLKVTCPLPSSHFQFYPAFRFEFQLEVPFRLLQFFTSEIERSDCLVSIETKYKSFAKRCQLCCRAIVQLCNRTRFFGFMGEVCRLFVKTSFGCVSLQTRKRRLLGQLVRLMQQSQIQRKRCRQQQYGFIRKSNQDQLRRICRVGAFLRLLEISSNSKTVEMAHHCFSTLTCHSAFPSYHQISNFFPYLHNFFRAIFLQPDIRRKLHSINSLRNIGKSGKLFKNIVQLRHLLSQQTIDHFFGNADQLCLG